MKDIGSALGEGQKKTARDFVANEPQRSTEALAPFLAQTGSSRQFSLALGAAETP